MAIYETPFPSFNLVFNTSLHGTYVRMNAILKHENNFKLYSLIRSQLPKILYIVEKFNLFTLTKYGYKL